VCFSTLYAYKQVCQGSQVRLVCVAFLDNQPLIERVMFFISENFYRRIMIHDQVVL
jgi:hypothetical protein